MFFPIFIPYGGPSKDDLWDLKNNDEDGFSKKKWIIINEDDDFEYQVYCMGTEIKNEYPGYEYILDEGKKELLVKNPSSFWKHTSDWWTNLNKYDRKRICGTKWAALSTYPRMAYQYITNPKYKKDKGLLNKQIIEFVDFLKSNNKVLVINKYPEPKTTEELKKLYEQAKSQAENSNNLISCVDCDTGCGITCIGGCVDSCHAQCSKTAGNLTTILEQILE